MNITIIVAGESDINGPSSDKLNQPQGIFVDKTTNALYVADLLIKSSHAKMTNKCIIRPYGLRVDEETKIVYVVDLMINRIQRWKYGETEGDTTTGDNGMFIIISFIFSYQ
ncbi:unnamed protein product [Rotaria sp. Silwood2]|nr:unnamed protein product [Rotaria sp. Silwood2]CAF2744027.1 unnamed protein product [Rotaria sp. Silwood2]CAF3850171.1 unnamed protein product [Rotaria sp. Silwood2]CAF4147363.1 unnamed protein product [Rotaria sp. Silwood2]